jgi:hypothetical protein
MSFQSTTINPTSTSPATDISKIKNDLAVLKGVLEGTDDTDIARQMVARTASTGQAVLPAGTTAERSGSPVVGHVRYNITLGSFEGYGATGWGNIGGGAVGGGNDAAMYENDTLVTTNYEVGQAALQACTISIATPGVITQANSYVAGQPVRLKTTGALPTGLATGGVYYVSATGLTTSSFQVSATAGGASINTTGTQSGTHTCGKVKSAQMAGPMTVASGVSVTVPTGAVLVVL